MAKTKKRRGEGRSRKEERKDNRSKESSRRVGKYGTKKKKQQSWRQRLRSWFQKSFTSGLKSLKRNSQSRCPRGKSGIMLLI